MADATQLSPSNHTVAGGVLLGSDDAPRTAVVYVDPQCPYSRRFELRCHELLRELIDDGALRVEYRIRSFLGPESERAANALALAAEAGTEEFDQLRMAVFRAQPAEHSGGFTATDLLSLGADVGLTSPTYEEGVTSERYAEWIRARDERWWADDPDGVPALVLEGAFVEQEILYDADRLAAVLRG